MIEPDSPFFSHATKDLQYFSDIVRSGALLCPRKLPHVRKFSRFTDEYVGRTNYVMFSLGFGYIVDNANMQVAFLFSEDLIERPGTILHIEPIVYALCAIIAQAVKREQLHYWISFFNSADDTLNRFNHPLLKTTFREYMLHYLTHDSNHLAYKDAWGPSAYSEGVIKILYESNSVLKSKLQRKITNFRNQNTIHGAKSIQSYLNNNWLNFRVYTHPLDSPLSDSEKTHTQLLALERVPLWCSGLIALCVQPKLFDMFVAVLQPLLTHIPKHIPRSLPIYCGSRVYSIGELSREPKDRTL